MTQRVLSKKRGVILKLIMSVYNCGLLPLTLDYYAINDQL